MFIISYPVTKEKIIVNKLDVKMCHTLCQATTQGAIVLIRWLHSTQKLLYEKLYEEILGLYYWYQSA